ncbi:alpha/beta hydrolase family protein [Hyphococcus sp.]|uniref:alpha/beta hydrolase family protein n=1 Tax=Hyphococcus sp. TaxID=2038636 RepID=UPI00208382FE|nr:MAG: hypothetical protein DHS20C04_17680 [Marinicaulis sp.]
MRLFALILFLAVVACDEPMIVANVPAVTNDPAYIDEEYPPSVVELGIDSYGERMNGHIYLADGQGPHPTVVMLHGFPGNEKNLDLAQAFRRAGWNALFFHYRGAWGSEGVFTFNGAIDDVASVLAFLRDPANDNLRVDPDRIALAGHSMGGFMALQGGARDENISCIVTMAAANFGDRAGIASASPEQLEGFKQYSDQLVMLNGFNGDTAIAELAAAGESFDNTLLAPKLAGKKLFLIAGERDRAVDIAVHERHMKAFLDARNIQLMELRLDADHSFSWHRLRLAHEIASWLDRECR